MGVLEGIASEGEALIDAVLLGVRPGLSFPSGGAIFSLVGELSPVSLSIASSRICSRVGSFEIDRNSGAGERVGLGVPPIVSEVLYLGVLDLKGGVLGAGDSLAGEMDLARSLIDVSQAW